MKGMDHRADGSDEAGRGLVVTIRIGPDGRLYFADIPPGLLEVAAAVNPGDETLRARAALASSYRAEEA
ncbi:MAG: hypothetical protein IPJ41_06460 [Phycisphaerales bacterium]|nr:hypothetical protein [Phycisphaerales bacterium]